MAPTEDRVAKPERQWGYRRGTAAYVKYLSKLPSWNVNVKCEYHHLPPRGTPSPQKGMFKIAEHRSCCRDSLPSCL